MTEAGALLNVSHAAIGQQVRALEAHLGLSLVARDGRGVRPTDDGARLGHALSAGFATMAREIEALTGADAARPLQITTTAMFASSWLMPRIGGFRDAHPGIDLMLNPTALLTSPEPGGVDVAIRYGRGVWSGLKAEMLVPTQHVVVAARSLVGDRRIDAPDQLLDFPWLQELGSNEARNWLAGHGVTETRVRGLTEVPGNLLLDGLRRGQGVVATTRAFVEPDIRSGDVVILFADTAPDRGYYLVTHSGPLRPAAKSFTRWLRREAASAG